MADIALPYTGQMAREHDPDRFLATMFAKPEAREALWALLAFNHEIAKTREVVSEPTIGMIRLQWWRDAVAEAYDGTPKPHQIVEPLATFAKQYGWSQDLFEQLIAARETDLSSDPPTDMASLAAYAEATNYPLFLLMAQTLGVYCEEIGCARAIRHLSRGYALTGILRAMAFYLAERYVPLPQDILAQEQMTASRVADFPRDERVGRLIKQVADMAQDELARARHLRRTVPRALRPICLPAVSASAALKRLKARDYNVFDEYVVTASPLQTLAYSWAYLTRRW